LHAYRHEMDISYKDRVFCLHMDMKRLFLATADCFAHEYRDEMAVSYLGRLFCLHIDMKCYILPRQAVLLAYRHEMLYLT